MNDEPASTKSSAPDFSKAGYGALGNVEVKHDASQHHQTTNHSTSHHEDKSQHFDQSVTKQTTVHHSGLPPAVAFAVICVIIAGFLFAILALKPVPMSSRDNDRAEEKSVASPVPLPSSGAAASGLPVIVAAEVGVIAGSHFTPRTSFKSGELLTLRLRVSRTCQLRVLYQPAQGAPMLMFPENDGGSATVQAGADVFIPDPEKVAAKSPDATAFQLYHDTGSGPPIAEQVVVQIADEPFAPEGAVVVTGAPRRTYAGLTLADARMRGAARLKGLDAVAAQARMETAMSQKSLPFTIQP